MDSLDKSSVTLGAKRNVVDFYKGKSVLITGAAGFLGSFLLEVLLRCCPGIQSVYILLREKKGVQPECRKPQILKKQIFRTLQENHPEVLEKIRVVAGDISLPDLGLCNEDISKMEDKVSIVFHCAASVSFEKPLRYLLLHNVLGTRHVIEFCRKLKNIDALIYTSSAFSNSNHIGLIKEEIYELPFPVKKILDVLMFKNDDEGLKEISEQCLPTWPNFYTLSKNLAENLLHQEASDLPVVIVRPSIILGSWKGVQPGYTEEGTGMIDISLGIGKGFIRVLSCDEEKLLDIVPVDVVANTLIVSAQALETKKLPSPWIVNCTCTEFAPCTWRHYIWTLFRMSEMYPLPRSYQKGNLTVRKNLVAYWVTAVLNHYAPALFLDLLLTISGSKPRLVRLYKFYDRAIYHTRYFRYNEWRFQADNFKSLVDSLSTEDEKVFPIDLSGFSIDAYTRVLPFGAPFYNWNTDKKSTEERMTVAYNRYVLTNFIKWFVIVFLLLSVFLVVNKI